MHSVELENKTMVWGKSQLSTKGMESFLLRFCCGDSYADRKLLQEERLASSFRFQVPVVCFREVEAGVQAAGLTTSTVKEQRETDSCMLTAASSFLLSDINQDPPAQGMVLPKRDRDFLLPLTIKTIPARHAHRPT